MDEASTSSKTGVPTSFFSLPRELRNQIYAYVLVDEDYINPWDWNYPHMLFPQLLRTNKTLHDEAAEVLYAHNRFNFAECHPDRVCLLLDKIGTDNLKHMRHVRIGFPMIRYLGPGHARLADESVRVRDRLKDCCSNLRKLTISTSSINMMKRGFAYLDHLEVATMEALELVNAHFRDISPLQETPSQDHDNSRPAMSIAVEGYEDDLDSDTRREMESCGWILDLVEREDSNVDDVWGNDIDDEYGDNEL